MQQQVQAQRLFFETGTTRSISSRIEQLKKLKQVLQDHESMLYEAIHKDFSKSVFETHVIELAILYKEINLAIKNLHRWAKPKRIRTDLLNFPGKSFVMPEPLGVTLIIGAWNYPYQLSLLPAINSIAAGNTVIIKPSELPAHASQAMVKMINNNFPPEYLHVVEGGIDETTALLKEKFDKIFFTGSTSVGKIVYQAAAQHLTPVTLELGGKSPAIITESCDLKVSVKRLVWAKFLNAGQTCIAPDYVLVHQSVKNDFFDLVKKEIENADYNVANDNYVQIISRKNVDRISTLIGQDKIITGGKVNVEERIIEPTVLTDISFEDDVMQEEIFGPVLPVIAYDNLDNVLTEVKKMSKPLACYLFTRDKEVKKKILNELSFGGGTINDAAMHFSNSRLPFGGVGDSGMGSYHGEHGFKNFSHLKSVLDKPTWLEPNIKYAPYTKGKLSLILRMMGLKS